MKCAYLSVVLLMMSLGCATKKPVKPTVQTYVTKDCVVGFVKASKCQPLTGELALCHDVVMKIACVKVQK